VRTCAVLHVSRVGFTTNGPNTLPHGERAKMLLLASRIESIYGDSFGEYGAHASRLSFAKKGIACGRNGSRRLMAVHGLAGKSGRVSIREADHH